MKNRLLAAALGLVTLALSLWWLSLGSSGPSVPPTNSPASDAPPVGYSETAPKPSTIRRPAPAVFGQSGPVTLGDIPAGRFADEISNLPAPAREHALKQLERLRAPIADVGSLRVDSSGNLYYACSLGLPPPLNIPDDGLSSTAAAPAENAESASQAATSAEFSTSVPVSSPPIRHSKLGSANVIYLDFNGHTVTGTAWNTSAGAPSAYVCIAFDRDNNAGSFSPAEQASIVRIWERVSESFRAFDVDVTTEEPSAAAFATNRVVRVLITRSIDANGISNPGVPSAVGVAYIDVFGKSGFNALFSVAFSYYDNRDDALIARTVSHEVGHTVGLSHDGTKNADGTTATEYYVGHSNGATSWTPIMGSGLGKMSQWSKGEYYMANNLQDDIAILSNVLNVRAEDHADVREAATALIINGAQVQHRGIISNSSDNDWFWFRTEAGATLTIAPASFADFGANAASLNLAASIHDANGNLIAASSPEGDTSATLSIFGAGTFYVRVAGTGFGNPLANPPTGYTAYGSLGQYTITGTITPTQDAAGPAIAQQPTDQIEYPGNGARFTLIASGTPATSYQWQRSTNSGTTWETLVNSTTHAGVTTSLLEVAAVDSAMNGHRYRCIVSNSIGTVTSSSATLTVQTPPVPIAPTFGSGAPIATFGRGLPAGTSQNLRISILGGTEPITLQWRLNGVDIPGANGVFYFARNWQARDAGVYTVVATNSAGTAVSQPYTQYISPEGGWTFRNPLPTGNGTTRAAFLNGQFFVGGLRGTLLVSNDGQNWITRTIPTSNNIFGLNYLNGYYVMLGSVGAVFSSPDAITWTPRNTGTLHQDTSPGLLSLANSGSRLMAVGSGGNFTTSTDGLNWTAGSIGTGDNLNGVAFGFGKFHAVSSTNGRVYSSADGSAWTSVASGSGSLSCIAFGAGRLVAAGTPGSIATSTDGVNWTSVASGTTNFILGVEFVNGLFVATGLFGTILTSPDGVQWTTRSSGGNLSQLQNTAFGNGRYVIPGQTGTSGRALLTSTDGITWTESTSGVGSVGTTLRAVGASSTSIVAVSSSGTILQSSNGVTWTQRASIGTPLNDVAFGNGTFLVVGIGGALRASGDGIVWSTLTSPSTSAAFNGITYSNDRWVLTGTQNSLGRIYTSINNGLSWSVAYTGNSNALNHAAYGNGVHIAVGNGGTIVRSTNGSSWTTVTSGTSLQLNEVAFGNGLFVAVGAGVVLTSPDGLTWTNRSFTPDSMNSVTYAGGYFIATGATSTGPGSTYYVSPDGITWSGRFTGAADPLYDATFFDGQIYGVGENSVILSAGAPSVAISSSITAAVGTTATLVGVPWASPVPVTYQWWHNDAPVAGANSPTLTLPNVQLSQAGSYQLVATNTFGSTTSAPLTLDVTAAAGSFAAWQRANFTMQELQDATATGPGGIASPDGLTNLLKYALGLPAKTPSAGNVLSITATDSEWIVTYTRPIVSEVSYAVEYSTDLDAWTTNGIVHQQISATSEKAEWQARLPRATAPKTAFFRLRVTR